MSGLQRKTLAPREPGCDGKWHINRRFHFIAGVTLPRGRKKNQACRTRANHCWPHRARDCGALTVSGCSRPGLHFAQSIRGHAFRGRRTAYPARYPDRLQATRCVVRARRTVHWLAPSRQWAPAKSVGGVARPGKHRSGGGARRGHHSPRRLRHRPWPRRRPPWRKPGRLRHTRRHCPRAGIAHWRLHFRPRSN